MTREIKVFRTKVLLGLSCYRCSVCKKVHYINVSAPKACTRKRINSLEIAGLKHPFSVLWDTDEWKRLNRITLGFLSDVKNSAQERVLIWQRLYRQTKELTEILLSTIEYGLHAFLELDLDEVQAVVSTLMQEHYNSQMHEVENSPEMQWFGNIKNWIYAGNLEKWGRLSLVEKEYELPLSGTNIKITSKELREQAVYLLEDEGLTDGDSGKLCSFCYGPESLKVVFESITLVVPYKWHDKITVL